MILVVLVGTITAQANDLQYVSETDLTTEVKSRKSDIARTKLRIASLTQLEFDAHGELGRADTEVKKIEVLVTVRAKMFYRLHRNGGTLRYLMGSSSAVELLKRLGELKHLLQSCLESRKQAGIRLAKADNKLISIKKEKQTAVLMLSMLQQTLDELRSEQIRRNGRQKKIASR